MIEMAACPLFIRQLVGRIIAVADRTGIQFVCQRYVNTLAQLTVKFILIAISAVLSRAMRPISLNKSNCQARL